MENVKYPKKKNLKSSCVNEDYIKKYLVTNN